MSLYFQEKAALILYVQWTTVEQRAHLTSFCEVLEFELFISDLFFGNI
jgi:hypothetical protein